MYTTVNMKPDYMIKLEKLIKKSKRSKTSEIEVLIDEKLENMKNEQ